MQTVAGQRHEHLVRQLLIALVATAGIAGAQEPEQASPSTEVQVPVPTAILRERIAEQRAHLEELRRVYTEKHPTVVIAVRQLEQLEAQLREEEGAASETE